MGPNGIMCAVTINVWQRLEQQVRSLPDKDSRRYSDLRHGSTRERLARFWERLQIPTIIGECEGKSGTLSGTIMEMRALDLSRKPMLVVEEPESIAIAFDKAYPMAKILVFRDSDTEARRKYLAEIHDFAGDVVICGRGACKYLLRTGRHFRDTGIDALLIADHNSWPAYAHVMETWYFICGNEEYCKE